MTFSLDKRNSNIAKGLASLFLIYHHLFYSDSTLELYDALTGFTINGIPLVQAFGKSAKVCVAVFVFLSGYGLTKKIQSSRSFSGIGRRSLMFSLGYIRKFLIQYWFVFITAGLIGNIFHWRVYSKIYNNLLEAGIDFLGLARMFGTPTYNDTWWYVSIQFCFYLLFPFVIQGMKKAPYSILVLSFILPFVNYHNVFVDGSLRYYLFPFVCGCFFAYKKYFDTLTAGPDQRIASVLFFITAFFIRAKTGIYFDGIFAIAAIMLCMYCLSYIPGLALALEHLGIISGFIFLTHTFMLYFFYGFIYSSRNSVLIYIVMAALSIITAEVLYRVYSFGLQANKAARRRKK